MSLPTEGKLLRIFVGEADHWHGKPLYEAIVLEARKRGLAGATVIKGFMGFGAHSRIHTAKLLELSQDLPIVIEIVDAPDKIEAFVFFFSSRRRHTIFDCDWSSDVCSSD